MNYLNDWEEKKYNYLKKICDLYNEETLKKMEDNIFNENKNDFYDEKKYRIKIENKRIEKYLLSNSEKLAENFKKYNELQKMVKLLSFDKTLVYEVSKLIIEMDLDLGLKIRLLSSIPYVKQAYDLIILERSSDNQKKN